MRTIQAERTADVPAQTLTEIEFDRAFASIVYVAVGDFTPEFEARLAEDLERFRGLGAAITAHQPLQAIVREIGHLSASPHEAQMAALEVGVRLGLALARERAGEASVH